MENHFHVNSRSNTVSLLSLSKIDSRARYYSLGHNDMIDLSSATNNRLIDENNAISPSSGSSSTAKATTIPIATTTMMSSVSPLSLNARRLQQRYKLLSAGSVQICRVPHAKNIIEKIRFSRFLRRWEEHQIQLNSSEILSSTVRC